MQPLNRWSRRPSPFFFLCFSLLLLATVGQAHSQPISGDTVSLAEGVVIDHQRATAFVMKPGGGIDAVDLRQGQTVWSTEVADKPLWISENQLVAQAESENLIGALDIVAVNTSTGDQQSAARVDLPSGIYGGIDDQLGKAFRARAEQVGEDLVLSWTSRQQLVQGISRPTVQTLGPAETKSAHISEGALRLDLNAGKAFPLRQAKAAVAPRSHLLELTSDSGIPGASGRQFLSVDGRHILVSTFEAAGDSRIPQHRWTLYSRESGVFVGELTQEVSVAPFLVADGQLLIASPPFVRQQGDNWIDEPLKLRSVDLQSGEESWSRELRDTTYRGPFPP